jgi:trk system potassium uptake protein TrkA
MNVIVIGCGRVGSELARSLTAQGHSVAVVDRNPQAFLRLGPRFEGLTVRGDVLDESVMRRAGVEAAQGFAAVTPSDETNLVAAKTARDLFHVPHVVARVYDPAYARVFEHAGLETVASSLWGASRVEHVLLRPDVAELEALNGGGVRLVELRIPAGWAGKTIEALAAAGRLQPSALVRGSSADLADPASLLQEQDRLVAAVRAADLPALRDLLAGRGG